MRYSTKFYGNKQGIAIAILENYDIIKLPYCLIALLPYCLIAELFYLCLIQYDKVWGCF